jgi:hypothetical protein
MQTLSTPTVPALPTDLTPVASPLRPPRVPTISLVEGLPPLAPVRPIASPSLSRELLALSRSGYPTASEIKRAHQIIENRLASRFVVVEDHPGFNATTHHGEHATREAADLECASRNRTGMTGSGFRQTFWVWDRAELFGGVGAMCGRAGS